MFLRTSGSRRTRRCCLVSATSRLLLSVFGSPRRRRLNEQPLQPLAPSLPNEQPLQPLPPFLQILKGRIPRLRSIGGLPVGVDRPRAWLRLL